MLISYGRSVVCSTDLVRAMKLRNRVAIVTGAGGGLWRCHAWLLARLGARLVVNDMNGAAAEAVAGQIRAAGGEAIAIAASVTDSVQVAAMVERVTAEWGRKIGRAHV